MTIFSHPSLIRDSSVVCTISLVILSIFNLNQLASAQLTFDLNNNGFVRLSGENYWDIKRIDNIKTRYR